MDENDSASRCQGEAGTVDTENPSTALVGSVAMVGRLYLTQPDVHWMSGGSPSLRKTSPARPLAPPAPQQQGRPHGPWGREIKKG